MKTLIMDNIKGFIMNIPSEMKVGFVRLPIRRKHWICIRQVNSKYYNLDSKLDFPQLIGSESDVIDYLKEEINCDDKELFLVVEKHVADRSSWKCELLPDGVEKNMYSEKHCINTNCDTGEMTQTSQVSQDLSR